MPPLIKSTTRYASYPVIMGLGTYVLLEVASGKLDYWQYTPLIAATGIFIVATLEKIQPFEENG